MSGLIKTKVSNTLMLGTIIGDMVQAIPVRKKRTKTVAEKIGETNQADKLLSLA